MKKTLKKLGLIFVAVATFLVGNKALAANTREQTGQAFTYDFELKLELGDELTKTADGKNYIVPITGYADATHTTEVNLSGEDAVHYKVSKITLEQYNTMLAWQNEIDKLDRTAIEDDKLVYQQNENITKLQEYIRNNEWWCYNKYEIGQILLPVSCQTTYYVITVDAMDESIPWNRHVSRVYKVEGDQAVCGAPEDSTKEENPKTGIATPYIICGTIALGSIAVITLSKKKKYI